MEGNPYEVEIGYGICKKHSGKGYATEVLRSMSEFIAEDDPYGNGMFVYKKSY